MVLDDYRHPSVIQLMLEICLLLFVGSRGFKGEIGLCPENCDVTEDLRRLRVDFQGNVCS